jgi:hypothetical protein
VIAAYAVIVVVAFALAAFVLAPLFRPGAAEAERVARRVSEEEDLHAQHAMALTALRDLEEDRATGKIGDDDYTRMKAALESRAIDLMKRIDAVSSAALNAPAAPAGPA